ncbi:T9SS type A sorting domain-containing protein [Aureispira sp. CCB-QB1]|uniref:T9SS type A sorting domain-containing protein n=1 Tax=Aureispira sp. CCB-QB1 TaxID=1313421 RepID=UPI000697C472|nr:T9SS type A sorting domain-containing protein [Aureispira sp. CCB-QB1]
MKQIYIILFFLLIQNIVIAQHFEWVARLGGSGAHGEYSVAIGTDSHDNIYTANNIYHNSTYYNTGGAGATNLNGFVLTKSDNDKNIIWTKSIAISLADLEVVDMAVSSEGNVVSVGLFKGTKDFDPGAGVHNLTSGSNVNNIFIQKLDSNGNFLWAEALASLGNQYNPTVTLDTEGNIIVSGEITDTVDFDFGPSVNNVGATSFILKLTPNGDVNDVHEVGSLDIISTTTDRSDNIFLLGKFSGTKDFDPGVGVQNITAINVDYFILKLDSIGGYNWVHHFSQGTGTYNVNNDNPSIVANESGEIYTVGTFHTSTNLNPTGIIPSVQTAKGGKDIFILKLDVNGNFVWGRSFGGVGDDIASSIVVDSAEYIYTAGSFRQTVDFDPSYGVYNLVWYNGFNSYGSDGFIQKLDPNGNFVWVQHIRSVDYYYSTDMTIGSDATLYTNGFYRRRTYWPKNDGTNISISSSGGDDIAIGKILQDSCSSMGLVIDTIIDATCGNLGLIQFKALGSVAPHIYTWNTTAITVDSVLSISTPGVYTVTVEDGLGCIRTSSVLLNGPSLTTSTLFDLNANLVATGFRPGQATTIWLDAFNDGCQPVNGQLSLVLSPLVNYDSASINPDFIHGDTLIWNFNALMYDSSHLQPEIFVTTSTNAQISDNICLLLKMSPELGDNDVTNNNKKYSFDVVNSYDPNTKGVYPKGLCNSGYVQKNKKLTYTIQFQNTGNAPAIDINILDTLSGALDVNSVRIVGKSHPKLVTHVLPGNVLRFEFQKINLPDSTTNENNSHGFIIFEVYPLQTIPNSTLLSNSAAIYFDFNDPIITNTVHNIILDTLPVYSSIINISSCSSYIYNNNSYDTTGTYLHIYQTLEGCDSTVYLNLSILPPTNSRITLSQCDSFMTPSGSLLGTTGIYNDTITNSLGCDSIISIDFTKLETTSNNIFVDMCDSFIAPSGNIYRTPGIYNDTITNSLGCDSIILFNVQSAVTTANISSTLCEGTYFTGPSGNIYTIPGAYSDTITNSLGCDSIVSIDLLLPPVIDTLVTQSGISLLAATGNYNYQWIDCQNGNLPIPGETNQLFTPLSNGYYAVIIEVNGCSDTSECINVVITSSQSFMQKTTDKVVLFPNPTEGGFNIVFDKKYDDLIIEILDVTGKQVMIKKLSSLKSTQLNIEGRQGFYFIKVVLDNNEEIILKVLKF